MYKTHHAINLFYVIFLTYFCLLELILQQKPIEKVSST